MISLLQHPFRPGGPQVSACGSSIRGTPGTTVSIFDCVFAGNVKLFIEITKYFTFLCFLNLVPGLCSSALCCCTAELLLQVW